MLRAHINARLAPFLRRQLPPKNLPPKNLQHHGLQPAQPFTVHLASVTTPCSNLLWRHAFPVPPQDTSVQFLVGNGDTGAADALAATLSSNPESVLPPGTWGSVTVSGVQQARLGGDAEHCMGGRGQA